MEFIKTKKYIDGDFDSPVDYDLIKNFEKVKINQSLGLVKESENVALLKKYAGMGLKVIPIRRVSEREWSLRKDFPNRVMLEITSRCNFNCRMCPRHNLKRPLMDFDKKLFFKVMDELDEHGVEGVWLYSLGEPILHKNWKEMVEYAGNKDSIGMIWFSTNGFAFNEDAIDFALNSKISYLNFSLHGTNEDVYDFVSPKIHYKRVRENFELLLKKKKELGRGPILHIQMIDQEGTHGNINEFIETFYGTGEIVSINMLDYGYLPNNAYGLHQRSRPPVVKKCNRISRGDCIIASNGDVQPCDNTYNSEILLGNVGRQTVCESWNSEINKKMLELNEKGELYKIEHCSRCPDYDL
jgi:radical SAM protein with 4Fe4S-binding SPASM domain